MDIIYCDFINGDDDTGAGTSEAPYQTITKASIGLTGGDEVRVAKSPSDTALTGTLTFTAGSTSLTGASTLFTSELAIGDFVKGGDDQYYEVVTITNDTDAVLFQKYPSSTGSGVTGYKLGITSTGEAAASSTVIQAVSVSGISVASRLKISGGWDLSTTTQDGQTYFRQIHGTFASRYGKGLFIDHKHYIEIERLHFLRYDRCIDMNGCDYCKLTSPNLLSAGDEAFYLYGCEYNDIITPVINSSGGEGLQMTLGICNTITTPLCNSCDRCIYLGACYYNTITTPSTNYARNYGIYMSNCKNNLITELTSNYAGTYAVYMTGCYEETINTATCNNTYKAFNLSTSANIILTDITANDNSTVFGLTARSTNIIVNKYSGSGNSKDFHIYECYGDLPAAKCQHFQSTAGDNRCFYQYGQTYRDTTDARSTQCLKYDPSSAIYYIIQSFFFRADSGVAQTLSAYIKKEATFNGDVQGAIYFMSEKIIGWTDITPTADDTYEQKSLVAALGDITEDGVLELRIKVRGTAGNVFVDDLATA